MPGRHITSAERRHQDDLRLRGLRVGRVYESRLMTLRLHEVKRVLELCRSYDDPQMWEAVIRGNLSERSYLEDWQRGLYRDAGLPMARATAKDLRQAKASAEDNVWLSMLDTYARSRAGANIISVEGTFRDDLVSILADLMTGHPGLGIEKLARMIVRKYRELSLWQVRRIAQTETMIGMADAAAAAAQTLDVDFTKQWCTSGLENTRDSHLAVDGVEVDGDEPFRLEGGLLMYPHDTSLNAAAGEIINCACACIRRPK